MVFLPGRAASAGMFEMVARRLCATFTVVGIDLRGRGRSEAPAAGYAMADHAAEVRGVLEALGVVEPAVLVGHSFGGMLALYLGAQDPAWSGRLVVLDWAMALATPATLELLRPTLERLGQPVASWAAYRAGLERLPYLQGAWDADLEAYFADDVEPLEGGAVRSRARAHAVLAAIDGTLAEDWPAIVARVAQPVLLIRAEGAFGPAGAAPFLEEAPALAMVQALREARYQSVPGNHITMLFGESAERVAEAIAGFVGERP
jgi:pimeloyl-ACP methyl ester carboxylesterase